MREKHEGSACVGDPTCSSFRRWRTRMPSLPLCAVSLLSKFLGCAGCRDLLLLENRHRRGLFNTVETEKRFTVQICVPNYRFFSKAVAVCGLELKTSPLPHKKLHLVQTDECSTHSVDFEVVPAAEARSGGGDSCSQLK